MKLTKTLAIIALVPMALTGCSTLSNTVDSAKSAVSTASSQAATQNNATSTNQLIPVSEAPTGTNGFPTPASPIAVVDVATATQTLDSLKVEAQDSSGYNRTDNFGEAWDYNPDGTSRTSCDTRNVILARDMTDEILKSDNCTVLTGTLNDPYTGTVINFKRGKDSALVQIDHIIPLNQAWGSGARNWTQQARQAFANDPGNLMAVDGSANAQKSAKDEAQWEPTNVAYQCTYAVNQIRVKNQWNLSVDKAEKKALADKLASCK